MRSEAVVGFGSNRGRGELSASARESGAVLEFHLEHLARELASCRLEDLGERSDVSGLERGAGAVFIAVARAGSGRRQNSGREWRPCLYAPEFAAAHHPRP